MVNRRRDHRHPLRPRRYCALEGQRCIVACAHNYLAAVGAASSWTAFGLQAHRSQTFKLSGDPLFVDKVRDIVGLFLSPPNRAVVLSVDEKSWIQALDREQPVLPVILGVRERRTHS